MVNADQAQRNTGVDVAEVRPTKLPEQPELDRGQVGTGRSRPATHRLPEPPPITMSICEQARIERIPLTDGDPGQGAVGGEGEQDYAVVLRVVQPAVGLAEQDPVSTTDTSAGHGALTGDTGEPETVDDDTCVVRSVN